MNQPSHDNPCGLDGFSFLEFAGPDKLLFDRLFKQLGFTLRAKHKQHDISLYQQGNIQFILNAVTDSQAAQQAKRHGPGASAMGFRVHDAHQAFDYAIRHGAAPFKESGVIDYHLPAIQAIGGSVIYFVDEKHQPFQSEWIKVLDETDATKTSGLIEIDHLTHNVHRGNLDKWADFYASLFNFRQIRYFNIEGKMTGLISRALSSPCNKIKIPLNESKDDKSQIEEFLHDFHGEGIQHVALSTENIYRTVPALRQNGVKFLDVPNTYYDMITDRLPWQTEDIPALRDSKILIDGEKSPQGGLLLQIFTENLFGPVFFEIIQRKGNQGFGEGNFQALFEAIERDQIKRGTL